MSGSDSPLKTSVSAKRGAEVREGWFDSAQGPRDTGLLISEMTSSIDDSCLAQSEWPFPVNVLIFRSY